MQINLLGARVDVVDLAGAVERIAGFVQSGIPHQVVTLNPEILYRAQREPALLSLINGADLVTADGVGVVWAAKVAGTPLPERVTGIDLMLALVARAAAEGWRVFLLGASPGVAEEAARRLQEKHPGLLVAGTMHGYFPPAGEPEVVEMIRTARPHLLFVGLGAPKQEQFIARYKQALGVSAAMGVGGSFDVIAGKVARAPAWMRRMHLEWLGRLIREPRRFKRMLVLPRFAWLAWRKARSGRCGRR
ncbi:WecB/TagA/CpsF family glycosyltransferase [Desulfofundulus thermobenzoicus]|uniref:N-acetylglucosaminyldiphosphoundecaprenol N-acetyl-beta-D-mannosaminyltransferase n=1 Tax=Desulfofundulus thermobenzoicus TaxID=29376 RepID=A0A6N7INF1_9FIRM|nr:WecB/TagA/CpsF family glycosyltransferase [Desulfofundulus thermobenzoicus]MQL51535.1 WecB/TagA/CpsF family glycosyltransferase [Desulfofundulus thermobenzoicus]